MKSGAHGYSRVLYVGFHGKFLLSLKYTKKLRKYASFTFSQKFVESLILNFPDFVHDGRGLR